MPDLTMGEFSRPQGAEKNDCFHQELVGGRDVPKGGQKGIYVPKIAMH